MQPKLKPAFFLFIIAATALYSCMKEYSCEGCRDSNKPPIAAAGAHQTILLPKDSVVLDGSNSSDPDGKISAWQWTKLSGPATFSIADAKAAKTSAKSLVAGTYQFELKVTDDKGASAKDTVLVTVDKPGNQPPVAHAGLDKTLTLPANGTLLEGTHSTDPDNNIATYQWTKIAGPATFNLVDATAVETQLTDLVEGIYLFELKVTDLEGLSSKDTVQITVNTVVVSVACDNSSRPHVNVRLIPVGTLSQARVGMAVASAGSKLLFAGGYNNGGSSRVDIFDITTNTWSIAELCKGRHIIAAAAAGNKILFGGGETGDGTWPVDSVDIYDVSTNTWKVTHLSTAGHSIAAAAVGNKVLFAGGDGGFSGPGRQRRVDIYDLTTSVWSTAQLSEDKRGGVTAVTVNDKVYFAGGANNGGVGISNEIDIYNNATNSWSTSSLTEGKLNYAAIAVGNKIYWAGGTTNGSNSAYTNSCKVEVRDVNSGKSSIQHLHSPAGWWVDYGQNAVVKDNKIILYSSFGRDTHKIDIYDIATNTWSIGILPVNLTGASIISVNNTIYIAGGAVNGQSSNLSNKVYKLEF